MCLCVFAFGCVCLVVCACVWLCVCTVFIRFQAVSGSDVITSADDAEVLQTLTSDLRSCLHGNSLSDVSVIFCVVRLLLIQYILCSESACAAEPSCHHVALFNLHSQCELYSTHTVNTHCNASQQVHTHTHTYTDTSTHTGLPCLD